MKSNNLDYRFSVLSLSGKNFAVEVFKVKEFLNVPKISKIPNVHQSILGVFNLRGQIYPIIDIRYLLNLEIKPIVDTDYVVIMEEESISFGIIVDKVIDVLTLDSSKIQIPTREKSLQFVQYLEGVYPLESGMLHLLDIPSILNAGELRSYRY
jgi:purine-binding chemotaxis protein CheW